MEEPATSAKAGMLIVTHIAGLAMRVADHAHLDEGRIVEEVRRDRCLPLQFCRREAVSTFVESRYLTHHSIRGKQAHHHSRPA